MLVMLKYLKATSQLENGSGGSPPAEAVFDNIESYGDSVFRCPSGGDFKGDVGTIPGLAVSKTDPANDTFWRRQSFLFHGGGSRVAGQRRHDRHLVRRQLHPANRRPR